MAADRIGGGWVATRWLESACSVLRAVARGYAPNDTHPARPEVAVADTGDLAQRVVEMRKMIDGHVANEGAANFIVAGAAMQPAEEKEKLDARGKADHDPVGVHRGLRAEPFVGTWLRRELNA